MNEDNLVKLHDIKIVCTFSKICTCCNEFRYENEQKKVREKSNLNFVLPLFFKEKVAGKDCACLKIWIN